MRHRPTTMIALCTATLMLSAGASAASAPTLKLGDGTGGFRSKTIGNFSSPVYVHGPKGANGLVFVVEQEGVIKIIKGRRKLPGTFLNIKKRVGCCGEQGLLSVAFAPDYRKSRRFYVNFTNNAGDTVVREYRRSGKHPRQAIRASGRGVLKIDQPYTNHNGGQLQFGPDRKLYIATGDGGSAGDPEENAQNKSSLLGKLLRIDPRRKGKRPYSIPNDNPFVGKAGRNEIFALGLRNPWRFSFDRNKRAITIADVGQNAWEEINYETLASARGANFGWDAFEGRGRYDSPDASPVPANHEPPIFQYSHSSGGCSITGGYISRDRRIDSLFGRYLYVDLCKGDIRSLVARSGGASGDRSTQISAGSVSSFGEDSNGHLYYASLATGKVYAIVPTGKKK